MKHVMLIGGALCAATPALAQTTDDMGDMPAIDHAAGHDHMAMMKADADWQPSSGTSRAPGNTPMHGLHLAAGDWMVMVHGYGWASYTHQGGPRGESKTFVQSMAMIEASRPLDGNKALVLRSMLSLDPLMGDRGYPNLFATGETAGGVALVDRQHPHDLFMEMSARLNVDIGNDMQFFLYGGLPGEPALGPSAFMHRASARFDPDAPITHHWFDSTHITFGVITAGIGNPHWQFEASAFNGREPDEDRWDIEKPRLNSWSVRASWTPTPYWAAQISYGRLHRPELLHPGEDEGRLTASISYSKGPLAATAGWSRKNRMPGRSLNGWFAEANYNIAGPHNIFGRYERVTNDELFGEDSSLHDQPFTIDKLSLGYAWQLPLGGEWHLALGGMGSLYGKPDRLNAYYGAHPRSFVLFAKLSLGD